MAACDQFYALLWGRERREPCKRCFDNAIRTLLQIRHINSHRSVFETFSLFKVKFYGHTESDNTPVETAITKKGTDMLRNQLEVATHKSVGNYRRTVGPTGQFVIDRQGHTK